ncbi:MAG: hypothetical protein AB4050_13930 [Synechococcus sp.]
MHVSSRNRDRGYAVLLAVSATIVITSLLAAYYTLTSIETSTSLASLNSGYGFDAAEAGLNIRAETVRQIFQGFNLPAGTQPDVNGDPCSVGNEGAGDFICQNLNFNNYDIESYLVRQSGNPTDPPVSIQIPAGEEFAFLNAQEYRYSAFSEATRVGEDNPQAILQMVFRSRLIPLFQFAAFYENDLEILPGPAFDLRGRVHTNGDLYLNAGNRLTIDGEVTVAGDLYRGRKNNSSCGGNVSVTLAAASYPVTCASGRRGPISANTDAEVSASNGQIDVEIEALQLPPIQAFDPDPGNPDAEYWSQADLRIVLNIDAPSGLQKFDGTSVLVDGNFIRPEIRNTNGSLDAIATTNLNACLAPQPGHPNQNVLLPPIYVGGANEGDPVVDTTGNPLRTRVYYSNETDPSDQERYQRGRDYRMVDLSSDPAGAAGQVRLELNNEPLRDGDANYMAANTEDLMYPGQFRNVRENEDMILMDVNVRQLFDCIDAQDLMTGTELSDDTEGGLVIHMTIADDPSSSNPMAGKTPGTPNNLGIRLWNADTLDVSDAYLAADPTTPELVGLTIVSDQAIYTVGNYNCRRRFVGETAANTNDGDVDGYEDGCDPDPATGTLNDDLNNRYPAALLADSMNVLSENWNIWLDDGRYNYGRGPGATQNTIYSAFLAGTETTGVEGSPGGSYGGGLENYPRFHEDWGGIDNFYRGSLVSLGNPRFADGNWGSQQYRPPTRDWNYELNFNSASGLPPLSPRFVVLRQELFVRNFDR